MAKVKREKYINTIKHSNMICKMSCTGRNREMLFARSYRGTQQRMRGEAGDMAVRMESYIEGTQ